MTLSTLAFMLVMSVKRDVLSTVLCLRGSSHSVSLSLSCPPPLFLATVGLHCSKWEPVGVSLDPPFLCIALCNPPITGRSRSRCVYARLCSENMFEMNCSGVQLEADSKYRLIASIHRMYWHWPVCWADYKDESVHFQISQESHWSQADAFKYTLLFTATALSVLALSREFTEIRNTAVFNAYCVHPLSTFTIIFMRRHN